MTEFEKEQLVFLNKITMLIRSNTGVKYCRNRKFLLALDSLDRRFEHSLDRIKQVFKEGVSRKLVSLERLIDAGTQMEGFQEEDNFVVLMFLHFLFNRKADKMKADILDHIDKKNTANLGTLSLPDLFPYLNR